MSQHYEKAFLCMTQPWKYANAFTDKTVMYVVEYLQYAQYLWLPYD